MLAPEVKDHRRQDLAFLLDRFEQETRHAGRTLAVSLDGLVLIQSSTADPSMTDRLSALCSGFSSMALGVATEFGAARLVDVAVRLDIGWFVIVGPFQNALLMTVTHPDAIIGEINNALVRLGHEIAGHMSPTART